MSTTDVVAIAAGLIALVSLWLTVRLASRSLRVTTYSGATDLTLQVDRLMVEHPDTREFLYSERALDDSVDPLLRARVLAAAEFVLDVLECIWDHRAEYDPDDRVSWKTYIQDFIGDEGYVLRDMYEKFSAQDWYPALDQIFGRAAVREHERLVNRVGPMRLSPAHPHAPTERTLLRAGPLRVTWSLPSSASAAEVATYLRWSNEWPTSPAAVPDLHVPWTRAGTEVQERDVPQTTAVAADPPRVT